MNPFVTNAITLTDASLTIKPPDVEPPKPSA